MASQQAAETLGSHQREMNVSKLEVILTDATDHSITSIVATGATDWADTTYASRVTIQVVNGASNNVVSTIEGSLDGTNWFTLAYRVEASSAYTTGNWTVGGGAADIVHLDPSDYVRFVRVNIGTANANGSTFTVFAET